jgi:adenylyltransferase/sulfurtransferase
MCHAVVMVGLTDHEIGRLWSYDETMSAESPTTSPLSRRETLRYGRHLSLPEVGVAGQAKLKAARVACVGAGGLGAPVALYLAAAGVGRIGLIDHDEVDESNLQRQVLYRTDDVGKSKLEAARRELLGLNPDIQVDTHAVRLTAENALEILRDYDIVVDGADNFPTRYLVSDACVLLGKPEVWAAIYRWEGQISVFDASRGPCYRCLFPTMPEEGAVPDCAEGGVLGVLPGVIGTLQATEVVKLILGLGNPLVGRLMQFDALDGSFETLHLAKDPDCPACAEGAKLELRDEAAACAVPGSDAATGEADNDEGDGQDDGWTVSVGRLATRLKAGNAPVLVDCRQPYEWDICHLDPSILLPMSDLPGRVRELDPAAETVVLCHHGQRSLRVVQFLRNAGFANVRSLEGGIDAWSREIDPSIARY